MLQQKRTARQRRALTSLPLAAGAVIMLLGSGPALLAVGLAAELYGPRWVAGSALAFTAGALLAPWMVGLVERVRVPAAVTWPAWGAGMLVGGASRRSNVAGFWLFAQVLAGLCIAAFEGSMDAHIAARQARGHLMGSMAASEAMRALGSAAAVVALPAYVGTNSIAAFSGVTSVVLLATTVLAVVVTRPWTWSVTCGGPVFGTPAVVFAVPGMAGSPTRGQFPARSAARSAYDWRRARMEPLDDRYPDERHLGARPSGSPERKAAASGAALGLRHVSAGRRRHGDVRGRADLRSDPSSRTGG